MFFFCLNSRAANLVGSGSLTRSRRLSWLRCGCGESDSQWHNEVLESSGLRRAEEARGLRVFEQNLYVAVS